MLHHLQFCQEKTFFLISPFFLCKKCNNKNKSKSVCSYEWWSVGKSWEGEEDRIMDVVRRKSFIVERNPKWEEATNHGCYTWYDQKVFCCWSWDSLFFKSYSCTTLLQGIQLRQQLSAWHHMIIVITMFRKGKLVMNGRDLCLFVGNARRDRKRSHEGTRVFCLTDSRKGEDVSVFLPVECWEGHLRLDAIASW